MELEMRPQLANVFFLGGCFLLHGVAVAIGQLNDYKHWRGPTQHWRGPTTAVTISRLNGHVPKDLSRPVSQWANKPLEGTFYLPVRWDLDKNKYRSREWQERPWVL